MQILVSGATGYIGKRLIPLLLNEGHTVICVVRDKERALNSFINHKNTIIAEADFLKTDDCVFYGLVNNKLIQLAATGHKISSEKTILNN